MKLAALYIRVSTDKQRDEKTHQTQLDELRIRVQADSNLLSPEHEYIDDGWSGGLLERPALDRLRQDARQHKFEILYAYDRGRLSRIFVHQEVVIEELARYGVEFVSLHDINGTSPEERVMGGVMGLFHEYERIKTAERFRLAKLSKVRNGNLLGYQGPYGYDYIPVEGKGLDKVNGRFVINEAESEVVVMIFDWFCGGCSIRQIRKRLLELEIPPRKQKQETWTTGPIRRLLSNQTYIGRHFYNKSESIIPLNPKAKPNESKYRNKHTTKTSRKARPREEWLEVEVPAIITPVVFAKAQELLKQNIKFSPRNNKRNSYLLNGLVFCTCGQTRTGDPGSGHTYYRCIDRMSRFPQTRKCFSGSVNSAILDGVVWKKVEALLSDPERISKHAEKWLKDQEQRANSEQAESTRALLEKLRTEEERYARAYGTGIMSEEVYVERMRTLIQRRNTLKKKAEKEAQERTETVVISVSELTRETATLLKKLDFSDKKAILRRVVERIEVDQKEATICGQIPLTQEQKVGLNAEPWHRRPAERR